MNKKLRIKVYNKYNGRCSYCGRKIEYEDMQVDHLIPQRMFNVYRVEGINKFSNLMPSCRRCNHYKRAETLETFRHNLITLHERIMKNYICKVGVDFGIVEIKVFDGIFYCERFEKRNSRTQNEDK